MNFKQCYFIAYNIVELTATAVLSAVEKVRGAF